MTNEEVLEMYEYVEKVRLYAEKKYRALVEDKNNNIDQITAFEIYKKISNALLEIKVDLH